MQLSIIYSVIKIYDIFFLRDDYCINLLFVTSIGEIELLCPIKNKWITWKDVTYLFIGEINYLTYKSIVNANNKSHIRNPVTFLDQLLMKADIIKICDGVTTVIKVNEYRNEKKKKMQ